MRFCVGTSRFLLLALILSLVGLGFCEPFENKTVSNSSPPPLSEIKSSAKPLASTASSAAAVSSTKARTTKAYVKTTESTLTLRYSTTKLHAGTKGLVKSARRQKWNNSNASAARVPERVGAIECDLPVLPTESRLWRGNETHELKLPLVDCPGVGVARGEAECPPVIVSWEGSVDIQSGDILIVRINDSLLEAHQAGVTNTLGVNSTIVNEERKQHALPQPAVYAVTRQGHEHCDVSDGMLLDITPLDERDDKLITLYDKDLSEGVNLLIEYTLESELHELIPPAPFHHRGTRHRLGFHPHVVSIPSSSTKRIASTFIMRTAEEWNSLPADVFPEKYDLDLFKARVNRHFLVVSVNWGTQCVRLKVTVKSDNCGESQDCSGKGVCYTNVSMEGFECQCCPGSTGPHCEEHDVCNPSPCLNNGICVDLTQPLNGATFHCLCPYGFTGRKCEKDPCYSAPCLNGGSCMSMAMNGSTTFHCACADNWTGAHCEIPVGSGACTSNPCVNGICIEQNNNEVEGQFRCFCLPGYTGDRCEIEYNECESNPCGNGGTCTDRVGGFTCTCSRGYTGNTCLLKVDLCSTSPCPTRQFCMDRGNSYVCECPRGYVGDDCHVPVKSACDNNPCTHGGTCWNGVDSFYCSCRPGYTGKLCEEDFILESVTGDEGSFSEVQAGGGSVREVHMPLGLYHDRLHNVYIAAGTLGAAIAIVGVVVTACHCRVNKTYSRLFSRLTRSPAPAQHWLQGLTDKRPPLVPPTNSLETADMYYTLDFSDSQSSPLIQ